MNAIFRPRRSILAWGAIGGTFFLLATLGYAGLFFAENSAEMGFTSNRHAEVMGYIGIVLFGSMFGLTLLTIARFFVECVSIDGSTLRIRSLFQKTRFDVAEVEVLYWKLNQRLRFSTRWTVATLDLGEFYRTDRLNIIRALRRLIPAVKQTGWDEFCHRVALPLREHSPATATKDRTNIGNSPRVLVTRGRYDRLAFILLPLSLITCLGSWWMTDFVQVLVVPLFLAAMWCLLHYSVPKEGQWMESILSFKNGKSLVIAISSLPLSAVLIAILRFLGYSEDQSCTAGLFVLVPGFVLVMYYCWKTDNERKAHDAGRLTTSLIEWEAGERYTTS
jgi:hypothetical protein